MKSRMPQAFYNACKMIFNKSFHQLRPKRNDPIILSTLSHTILVKQKDSHELS